MQNSDKDAKNTAKKPESERKPFGKALASEIISGRERVSKAKDMAIKCLAAAVVIVALGMAIINYCNDREWRKYGR